MENNNSSPVESSSPVSENAQVESNESSQETSAEQVAQPSEQQAAQEAKKKEEQIKRNIKKLKLKVDGEEIEDEIDLDDEKELVKRLQLAKVSQKRMQESAALKKQVESLAQALQQSPEEVMRHLGMDPEDWAVKLLQKKLEEESKSPEVREREKMQKELEELRAAQKKAEEEKVQREQEATLRKFEEKFETDIIQAIEKSGLSQKPYTIKKMAEILSVALDNNIELTPDELAKAARKEVEQDIRDLFASSPDDFIEAMIGKERISGMRKKQIAAIKQKSTPSLETKATGESSKDKEKDNKQLKKITMSDFLRG